MSPPASSCFRFTVAPVPTTATSMSGNRFSLAAESALVEVSLDGLLEVAEPTDPDEAVDGGEVAAVGELASGELEPHAAAMSATVRLNART